MWPGLHAEERPDHPALVMGGSGEVVTYALLDERSNRLANLFYERGLRFGDHIALLMENNAEYIVVAWAAQRSGLYCTPINWHFTAEEAAYVLGDCDARALVTSYEQRETADGLLALMPPKVETLLMRGGTIGGYESYEEATATYSSGPLAEQLEGHMMMYSSGTTGRPKGIKYELNRRPVGNPIVVMRNFGAYEITTDDVYLSPAPLYHSAPLQWTISMTRNGATTVIMERFDPEECLALIERYRVTVAQFVPTMFVRMLKLPEEIRTKYDMSSLQLVLHAAAPCPVPVKAQMIEWWGPIIHEYDGATEGNGATTIDSHEWLAHPGSVGKMLYGKVHIVDDDGNEAPTGESGRVFFEGGESFTFEYYKDPEKTARTRDQHGWSTVGDVGYLDEDGYLYLTDRKDFMIIAGGVNIYPQEAENLLITHPKVYDAAVFGVPNAEMGEEVKAVVQPLDPDAGGPELAEELMEFCREHLARYKCPRSIDFEAELPRHDTGKLYKRLLRDRYWGGHESRIV